MLETLKEIFCEEFGRFKREAERDWMELKERHRKRCKKKKEQGILL